MSYLLFKDICKEIPTEKLSAIIHCVLKTDKKRILRYYCNKVSKYFNGFRDINRIPYHRVFTQLLDDCKINNNIAGSILEVWYEYHSELVKQIVNELINLDYKYSEAQFYLEGIEVQPLKAIHITKIDDKVYADFPICALDEDSRFNITLITILLGWYPEYVNEENHNYESKNKINQMNSTTEISTTNNAIEISTNVSDDIVKLKDLHNNYIEQKNIILTTMSEIINDLSNDTLSGKISHVYDFLNEFSILNKDYRKIIDEVDVRLHTIVPTIYKSAMDNNQANIIISSKSEILLRIFEQALEYQSNLIYEKTSHFNDIINELDEENKQLFKTKINSIQDKYLKDIYIDEAITRDIDLLSNEINDQIIAYDLNRAYKDLSAKKSARAEKYIYNTFDKYGNDLDKVTFFVFLMENYSNLSNELQEKILEIFISYLSSVPNKDMLSILEEEILFYKFINIKSGRAFISLTALILYFSGDTEMASARLYLEGVNNELTKLDNITNKILLNEDIVFYNSLREKLNEQEKYFEKLFQKDNRQSFISQISEPKYRHVIDTKVIIGLEKKYSLLKKTNGDNLIEFTNELKQDEYCQRLYSEYRGNLPENFKIDKKIISEIEKVIIQLIQYAETKHIETVNCSNNRVDYNETLKSLNEYFEEYPFLNPLREKLYELINNKKANIIISVDDKKELMDIIVDNIVKSKYFNLYCPELIAKLQDSYLSNEEIVTLFLEMANENNTVDYSLEVLSKPKILKGILLLLSTDDIRFPLYNEQVLQIMKELKDIESYIIENSRTISDKYFYLKEQGRWKLCYDILYDISNKIKDDKKKTSEAIYAKLKEIGHESARMRITINEECDNYTDNVVSKIYEGLRIVDEISIKKKEMKIPLGDSILKEINHLRQFSNESLEQLENMIGKYYDNSELNDFTEHKYLNLPLIDILKYLEIEDYLSLGITKKQWDEISSDRKSYIIKLLQGWLYLADKPTTKEDIQKSKMKVDELENELEQLIINIASICSLYRTNDNKKIGQDPTHDWVYSNDLPFTYTTRLIYPRCSSLDRPIRFYVLSKSQLSSKKYIGRIKDYISEKKYDQNGFNLFVILTDNEHFKQINTFSVTKDLPTLDENILKRIIFSTTENKSPKWEFVSLLTLNKKISTIQPFKTQGSVDSTTGIFVGRGDLIKEITNSQKDYAIYGGRRIGKSSLLSVIRENLIEEGYIISYQSFQGIDSCLTIAKSIIEDFKRSGMISSSLVQMDTLDEFSQNLFTLYRENESQKIAIIIDEMDELIHKERSYGRHQIIEIFRNISHQTSHLWRFIFAGYKEMYLEIQGKGVYEHWKNPWQNFVDDSNMQLSEIESPRELIDEGLKNILGLEYDKDIIDLITNYSTGHPAFLQKFCECLVKMIDNRISLDNRRIYKKDVNDVFEKDSEFIRFVKGTLDLNLSDLQELITVIAAIEDSEVFTNEWIREKLKNWIRLYDVAFVIEEKELELALELLTITGLVKRTTNRNEYKFSHPHYIKIIKKLENVDNNLVENLLNKLKSIK